MRTFSVALLIVGGLVAGPAFAEMGNKAESDHSTHAIYTRSTAQRHGPDHAHVRDQRKCQNMGFKLGTDAFANCQLQLNTNRTQRRTAEARAQAVRDAAYIQAKAAKDLADRDASDAGTGLDRYAK